MGSSSSATIDIALNTLDEGQHINSLSDYSRSYSNSKIMRLALLAAVAFAATSLASPAQDKSDPTFCDRGKQLCEIANSWDDCSELYIQTMKAYVLAICAVGT